MTPGIRSWSKKYDLHDPRFCLCRNRHRTNPMCPPTLHLAFTGDTMPAYLRCPAVCRHDNKHDLGCKFHPPPSPPPLSFPRLLRRERGSRRRDAGGDRRFGVAVTCRRTGSFGQRSPVGGANAACTCSQGHVTPPEAVIQRGRAGGSGETRRRGAATAPRTKLSEGHGHGAPLPCSDPKTANRLSAAQPRGHRSLTSTSGRKNPARAH